MSTQFELPPFKGIADAIADVREYGARTKHEKLIGLRQNGTQAFVSEGDGHMVEIPEKWRLKCNDVLLVHCHPTMPTELSDADIKCIVGARAWGNLAACCEDDTISWTQGLADRLVSDPFTFILCVDPMLNDLSKHCIIHIAKKEGKDYGKDAEKWEQYANSWTENDDRYIKLAHLFNEILAHKGILKDYHLRLGDRAKAILGEHHDRV
jgi:hypothetical protein